MKRIALVIAISLLLVSCTTKVEYVYPSFVGASNLISSAPTGDLEFKEIPSTISTTNLGKTISQYGDTLAKEEYKNLAKAISYLSYNFAVLKEQYELCRIHDQSITQYLSELMDTYKTE